MRACCLLAGAPRRALAWGCFPLHWCTIPKFALQSELVSGAVEQEPYPHTYQLLQEDLIVHIERGADYDGIAVAWGMGNKKASLEECALACKRHVPPGVGACALSWACPCWGSRSCRAWPALFHV